MGFHWIHLSDFHFTNTDPYERNLILKALVVEIQRRSDQGFHADALFATGDIGNFGKKDEYKPATEFFDAVLQAASLDKSRLFVVPGNHDLDKEAGSGLARSLNDEQESVCYFSPEKPKHHFQKFKAFKKWFNGYFKGIRTFPVDSTCYEPEILLIDGSRIAVLALNTALFSLPDEKDHSRLWIGRRNFDVALDKLNSLKPNLTVALMHHPLDWLHDAERSNIKAALHTQVDFVLRGHLHENDFASIVDAQGGCLHLAAGACYQHRNYPNTSLFCTVDIDKSELKVEPTRYADSPKPVWTMDTSLFLPPKYADYIGRFPLSRSVSAKHVKNQQGQFANAIRQQIQELLTKPELDVLRLKLLADRTDKDAVAILLPEADVLDYKYIESAITAYHVAVETVRDRLLNAGSGTIGYLKSLLGWLVLLSVNVNIHPPVVLHNE